MVRYAEWREAVDPERPLERLDPVAQVAWGLLGALGGSICCGVGSIPGAYFSWQAAGNDLLRRRVARLRDDPSRHLQIACRLRLEHGNVLYGSDEGLLSLVEGMVLFEGRRASFSVPRDGTDFEDISGTGLSFRFKTPAGPCQATVETVDPDEVKAALRLWRRESFLLATAVLLPPFRPDEAAWRRVRLHDRLACALGLMGVAFGMLWAFVVESGPGLLAALVASTFAYGAWDLTRKRHDRLVHLRDALPEAPAH